MTTQHTNQRDATKKPSSKNKSANKAINGTKQALLVILHSLKWLLLVACLGGVTVFGVLYGYVSALVKDDPLRSREEIITALYQNSETGYIYFRDDGTGEPELMGQLRSEVDRQPITSIDKEVPQIIIDAFLAVEDNDFMEHKGIDIGATLRAVRQQFLNESRQTGGSTITQQLARNLFLSLEQTHSRKFKEILLAMRMERYLSKEQILIGYLNKIPFGASSTGYQVYGIKAAARGIFNLELDELNIAQAAYLAGLPQAPHTYSAFTGTGAFKEEGFNKAMQRQRVVLYRMLQEGKITEAEYEEALAFDIRSSLAPPSQKAYNKYPFLMLEVEQRATKILALQNNPGLTMDDLSDPQYEDLLNDTHKELLNGGYQIYTTVDKDIYEALQELASNPENFSPDDEEKGVEQVGAIMIDNETGAILAMIEGRDYNIEQLNHATQMKRQPGSAMKPIAAYLPAIEDGKIQPATVVDDSPIILPDGGKGFHIPNNVLLRFDGLMTARHALNHSYNVPAIKIYNNIVGIENGLNFAKKLGITTIDESDYYAATGVIGGMKYGVTVEELTNAYAAIASYGEFKDAYLIEKITTMDGEVVYEHKVTPERVFSEQSGYLMTDMLRTVIQNGSATSLKSDFKHWDKTNIAGKTGTTQNYHDVWFVGYSPDVTVGVWIGYDQQAPLSREGRRRAREIWAKIMNTSIETRPELFPTKDFPRPDGIVEMTVSSVSGDLPSELVRKHNMLYRDIFNKKYIPVKEDSALVEMEIVRYGGLNYLPRPETPRDFVQKRLLVRRNPSIAELIREIQEMFEKYPNSRPNRSLSFYIPRDAHLDAPTLVDPREDDGLIPATPGQPAISRNAETGEVTITFQATQAPDLIGYRLYKSVNGMPYQVAQILYAGDETVFKDTVPSSERAAYYITAVDVVGKESPPTQVLLSHSDAFDPGIPLPPFNGNGGEGENGDADGSPGPGGSTGGSAGGSGDPLDGSVPQPGSGDEQDEGPAAAPSAPKNVTASADSSGTSVSLSWDPNPEQEKVTSYEIYYSVTEDGPYAKIGSTTETYYEYISFPISGWYRVAAVNAHGTSSYSAPVHVE